jgi:hypothetical protein
MNPAAKTCGNFESTPAYIKIIENAPHGGGRACGGRKSNQQRRAKSRLREHDHKASSSRLTETRAKLAQMPAAQLGQALSDLSEVTSDLAQDFERPLNSDDQWLNV